MSTPHTHFWHEACQILERGERFFLVVVAAHSDHSPGTAGAKILVSAEGQTTGTIGGGSMEHQTVERAKSILSQDDFTPELHTLIHRAKGEGEKSGMLCAGSQTNLMLLCTPENDRETVAAIYDCLKDDRPGTLRIDTGGLVMDRATLPPGLPRYELHMDDPLWAYTERLLNDRRVAILGGGHCSTALAPVMLRLGYAVTVIRRKHSEPQLSHSGDPAIKYFAVNDYSEAAGLISYPELTRAIIMTTDTVGDIAGLLSLQSIPLPFIGLMGSVAKIATIRERGAETKGEPLNESNLYAPVGLPIDSHTPEEIAISVAAQLISLEAELSQARQSTSTEATTP